MKIADMAQMVLMWFTFRSDVNCATLAFSISYVMEKWLEIKLKTI